MPGIDNLYTALKQEGLYTKSLDEFKNQFSTPESIQKLHTALGQENLYTKSLADFQNQFFGDILKKKEEGLPLQPLADGGLLGTSAMAQDQQLASSGEGQLYDLGPIYQQYQQQQAQQPKAQEYVSFEEEAPKTGLFGEAAPVAPEPISLSKAELTEFMPFATDEQIIRGYLPENYEQLSPSEKVKAAAELTKIPELIPIFEKKAKEEEEKQRNLQAAIDDTTSVEQPYFTGAFGEFLKNLDNPMTGFGNFGLGDFIDDMGRAFDAGAKQGDLNSEAILLSIQGAKATPEQIDAYIKAANNLETTGPSDEMVRFQKIYEAGGKDFFSALRALYYSPGAAVEVMASSLVGMANKESLKAGGATVAAETAIGAATTGPQGALISAIKAIPDGFAVAGATLEYGISFNDFLREELTKKGLEFNREDIKTLLEDSNAMSEMRTRAAKRAGTVLAFDAMVGRLSGAVGAKLNSNTTAGRIKGTLAATATEMAGGSAGEAAARAVAGQEQDAAEILLEGAGEAPMGIINVASAAFVRDRKIASAAISQDQEKKINENNAKIEVLKATANATSNENVRSTINETINAIEQENKNISEQVASVVSSFSEEDKDNIVKLTDDFKNLEIKAAQINDDKSIDDVTKSIALGELKKQAIENIKQQQTIVQNAVQKQTTSEVPVQPEARVGEEMAEGAPETKPEVVTEEGKVEEVTPEFYVQELDRTKASDPTLYWSVDPVELETAKGGTVVSVDGGYGFVSPEGDIKGVFKTPETTRKGVADDVLKEAVKNGGIKLDNFDTYLTKVYKKNGFRIASRMEFAEEFAPKGWNKEVHGTPDVVAMVYDPNNQLDIEEKTFDDYDEAMAYRDSFVEQARALQEAPAVEQITVTSTPSEVKQSIDAASTALGVAFPEVEFIVGDNLQDTRARIVEALTPRYGAEKAQAVADGFTNVRGQALFAGAKPIAIVINKTQANNRTAGHEAWEVMLNDAFGQNPEKFAEFRKAIDAQLKVSGYEDVAEALTKFSNEYADQGTEAMFREYMAEFGGMLVEGGLDPKNLTQQEKTLLEKIKDIINKFALELTGKEAFLKDATPENIIDFMVTISEKVSKGETVEQFFEGKDTTDIADTNTIFTNKSQKIGNFDIQYFEDDAEFQRLIDSGAVVQNVSIDEAAGEPVAVHQPDNLFVGNLNYKDKKIMDGFGGIYYVLKFGNVWASGAKNSAQSLANLINKSRKESSDGKGRLILVRGTQDKMISSVQGVKTSMQILEELVFDGLISTSDFRKALTAAGKKYNINFSGNSSAASIKKDIEDKFMNVSDSTFARRGDFFSDLITELGKLDSPNKNIEEIRKALGATKRIGFSKQGIRDQIGTVLTERLLLGLPNSHAYAIIEVAEDVKVIKDEKHPSYPFPIVTESGKPPVLKVLGYRPKATEAIRRLDGSPASNAQLGLAQRGMGIGRITEAGKKEEVKLTTEEIQTLNDNFGIQDGEVELRARSQKINPSEVKTLSESLSNLNDNKLESLKNLIHKDVKQPQKTQKAYKLFKVKKNFPGELFPLFVGANESVTTGDWIAAKAGELTTTKEGKTMVKSTLGPLAYRPGWHSGEFAIATHIGAKKNPSDKAPTLRDSDQVWAEVEVGDDFDWQTEANNRAEKTKEGKIIPRTAHITDQLPALGNYKYKTNSNMTGSWIISGEMKVNRVLTDEEVAKINEKSGSNDLPRVSPFDFDAYGFNQDGTPKNKKQVLSNQVARAYIIAKETGENPNLVSAVESATTITARSQKINYKDLPGYDRMRKEIDGIIEKATKRGATKARILEDVIGYLRTSKVYEIANDSQREQMERDIKKEFGERIKSAPKVDRLFGVIKDAKNITVDEMTVLKEKIKAEAKASRDAIAFINGIRSRISSEITAMEKSGVISARQVQAIINRLNKVNLTNPQAVNSFVDYMQKVFKNAEYAEKLSKSNDLAKRIKKLTKSDNIAAGTKAIAKQFSKIEPRRVENIDEYLENASALYEAMRPTMVKVTGEGVDARFKKAVDYDKLQDYSNRELDKQEKQKVDELLARNKDLVMAGILTEDMNLDEIKKLLDAIKEDDEATLPSEEKQKMIRDAVKKVFGYYRSIALSMIQRGVDPFTGDFIELTDSQKRVARRFLEINTDLLSLRDSYTAVESLENFIVNKSTDGMAATIADYLGVTNAQNLAKEGYKGKALRLFYSKKAGRAWAEQIEQLDLMVQRMFGGVNRALSFMRASGANEFKVGKTSAQVELNKILNKYANKFGKTDGFNSLENVMERGVLAFLSRTVNENTTRQQNEFERRKKLVEETLNYMKSGTEKEQKQAVELQKVYDKIVKGSSTLDQVKSKASKTNKDAVDFWISEWSDRYDNLQELSRNVYNVVLGSDIDYTPDRFRRVSGQDIAEAQWGESMFANNSDYFDTKEAGVLMENKRVKTLGDRPSRIVSFDFDVNMSNSMYDALIDINTAEATRQMKSFFESPSFDKIMASKDDSDVVKDRMKQYVIRSKRKDYVTQDQLSGLFKGLNIVAGLGAGRALGGILQVPKQTIGVAFNTMINSGGRLSWIDAMNSKEFIDNSGYAIALRGVASNADVQSINKILEKASQSTGESALRLINKANELWLETFLVKPDVWIARTSWISYYKQRLQKMGYDTSSIEWSSHKLNKEAADYAQAMVDRQQNYSDSDLAGDFFASKDPLKMFLRKTFFPFMTFVMNQKSRMYVDLSIIGNPTSSTEEKFNAAKSLSGMSIEMAVYAGMSMFFSNMLRELTDYLWGDEEDEEEKEKRMKRSAQYYAKNIAMDILSPIPATNEPVRIAFNAMLEKIGVDKDEFELPKDFTQKGALGLLGMNAIAAEKLIAAYEKIEMASSGKYTKEDFFGNEVQMQLDEETQKKMAYVAVADFMYAMGFLPTEAGTIANNATKKAKKMGKRIKEEDAESPSGGVIQAKVKKAEITKGE